jgi:hypothetical protein
MTVPSEPRLLLQYLEPSAAVDIADPQRLRDHLASAFERLPVTDLALGWRLGPEVIEAVTSVISSSVAVWRWVPVFVDSGSGRAADALVAVGPDGQAPPPFHDMADFRFLCLDYDEVVEAGLERAVTLGREIDAHGVLLDRIRWHSPSGSAASELTCFCPRSRERAGHDGLDLGAVAWEVRADAETLEGRRSLVATLLGRPGSGALPEFLDWRTRRVTDAVGRLSADLGGARLRTTLDVFTRALARSVGQGLGALAGSGAWSKSMTYIDAVGPASMPFELSGYRAWLEEAGDTAAPSFLADVLGFEAPGVSGHGAQLGTLGHEAQLLAQAVGAERAIVGVDAVEVSGVCDVDDADLDARVEVLRDAALGLSSCWELLLISEARIERLAGAWAG